MLWMASFFWWLVALAYRLVITIVLWPRSCWMAPIEALASASHVAKV